MPAPDPVAALAGGVTVVTPNNRIARALVARHDAACVETGGEVLFGTEEIAGLELLGEERVADPGNDLRRQR